MHGHLRVFFLLDVEYSLGAHIFVAICFARPCKLEQELQLRRYSNCIRTKPWHHAQAYGLKFCLNNLVDVALFSDSHMCPCRVDALIGYSIEYDATQRMLHRYLYRGVSLSRASSCHEVLV